MAIESYVEAHEEEARALLVELALEDQGRFPQGRMTRAQAEVATGPVRRHFVGENHVLLARNRTGQAVGLLWCVLYDPGTGLEGELAELYVRPEVRRQGIATGLCREAISLFRRRAVTLASVWTHESNPAALAVYRRAGFRPTEHTVLTWLPPGPVDPASPDNAR